MGLVSPATNRVRERASLAELSSRLSEQRVLLSGWELLGTTTLKRVQERLWLLVLPMVVLVLASLWFAFRRLTEVLLGVAVLVLERALPADDDGLVRLVLEFAQPDGPATGAGHGR